MVIWKPSLAELSRHVLSSFFADLAGFTAWSSEREPKDVFVLLETIYFAFDTIAKRRKVFKGAIALPFSCLSCTLNTPVLTSLSRYLPGYFHPMQWRQLVIAM